MASVVERGGRGNVRKIGIRFSGDAKKVFPQHPYRVWDPPRLLFIGH